MLRQYMESRLSFYQHSLAAFSSTSLQFNILHSVSTRAVSVDSSSDSSTKGGEECTLGPLYILDASFNPPTIAHMRMVLDSGLFTRKGLLASTPSRLLLLLATRNADKAPQPASLEHRLSMMEMFITDLLQFTQESQKDPVKIDLGVISNPIFVDKAHTIETSGIYPPGIEQTYLIGFDTLIRIINPQYYPPSYTLEPLRPFLEKHRLLVRYRPGDTWGCLNEQKNLLANIANGSLDAISGERKWVLEGRIKFCEVSSCDEDDGEMVSSTRVRDTIKRGGGQLTKNTLEKLITPCVYEWIQSNQLYV